MKKFEQQKQQRVLFNNYKDNYQEAIIERIEKSRNDKRETRRNSLAQTQLEVFKKTCERNQDYEQFLVNKQRSKIVGREKR